MMRALDIPTYLAEHKARVEARLGVLANRAAERDTLALKALRYALDAPGKRFRPLLTLAVADVYRRGDDPLALDCAVAVECVHTASLIFDDLPCMDDAALRRGRKPPHLIFGEGQAVLAGMALIAEANRLVIHAGGKRKSQLEKKLDCLELLNRAYSLDGLSGGQSDDLMNRTDLGLEELETIHAQKTGALFIAGVALACRVCDAPERERAWLTAYAKNLGLAFQIRDDLLDLEDAAVTGKDRGKDAGKVTFVDLAGEAACRRLYGQLMDAALANLSPLGRAAVHLAELTAIIRDRSF